MYFIKLKWHLFRQPGMRWAYVCQKTVSLIAKFKFGSLRLTHGFENEEVLVTDTCEKVSYKDT
ncbi:hypothetical protein OUZ56_011546 [Daphnia magna]|uniref:Uncharacterized protein n=1 Tax=Daphnia magna TaxID=35525 RepID=A0ABQ9Z0F5_9CRUS|nr:hypothetical protein OUZ56_011546 [Daphnia magna]